MVRHPQDKPLNDLAARCEVHLQNLDAAGHATASGELSLLIVTLEHRLTLARGQAAHARWKRSALKKAHRNLQAAYEGLLRWRDETVNRQIAVRNARNIKTAFPEFTRVESPEPAETKFGATWATITTAVCTLAVLGFAVLVIQAAMGLMRGA